MTFDGHDPMAPVRSPTGRFHHSGQWALYTSLSAEGTAVAIKRYMRPDDPGRVIHPLDVIAQKVMDLRGRTEASVVWQDIVATGAPSPTWRFSDAARAHGAQAMLYSSRSRPELSHLVVFSPAVLGLCETQEALKWPISIGHDTSH